MKRSALSLTLAGALLALQQDAASAAGFFDQGFQNPSIRTDFVADNEGMAGNQLTLTEPVYYGQSEPGTFYDPIMIPPGLIWSTPTFQSAYPYAFNSNSPSQPHWVLILNNELWSETTLSGAPGLSLPRVEPGEGIMGFRAQTNSLQGETFHRAHMVLNHYYLNPNPQGQGAIPFMSIGADDDRQPGGPLGAVRASGNPATAPHQLSWVSRMWTAEAGLWNHYLYVIAEWGGKPRMLLVNLAWSGIQWSDQYTDTLHRHWNWQFAESTLQPGADMVFIDADRLSQTCPGVNLARITAPGVDVTYTLNLARAFQCTSAAFDAPIPVAGEFPIHTVAWAVEATGETAIWASVHGMRLFNPVVSSGTRKSLDSGAMPGSVESADMAGIRRQIAQSREALGARQPATLSRLRSDGRARTIREIAGS